MVRSILLAGVGIALLAGRAGAAPCPTSGALTLTNTTCELSGVRTYTSVTLVNSTITVNAFDGTDKVGTGNLEIRSPSINIDATSKIVAKGSGYQTKVCGEGAGPATFPASGGRGGCSVLDSGGGGAHFGIGGRGTKDIPGTPPAQQFPRDFEEDCGSVTYNASDVPSCTVTGSCRDNDALPTIAGQSFYHSIYTSEFGASGGDKGCADGDGKTLVTAGSGGGRIVLAAVTATKTGTITINGTIDATGKRGCGEGNDSAGGGAGGTIFVAGDNVAIGASAVVSAAGGLGGDTQGAMSGGECPAPYQQTGTCDDCGGGGGGGIVSVLSGTSAAIADQATFNVNGALGGVCPICRGEAGGGVGELQISGGYVGEFCDGFDNDFDGAVDDNLPTISCNMTSMPSCVGGVPQQCTPNVATCQGPVTDSRARFAVILDTSGSMLGDLTGLPTFGDGSMDHPGLDHNSNALADDSRLFKAKTALTNVISAYPNIDFALARYHQDSSVDRSCQEAHNFECNALCCSYDNPVGNVDPPKVPECVVKGANGANVTVKTVSTANDECINYAGNCGPPRRGADVVAGFGSDINNYLMWLDGTETSFRNSADVPGAYCSYAAGGNCEMRGTGPTPLANSLQAVDDYLSPIKACDRASTGGCRKYGVILLTDGAESCQGDPVAAAAALRMKSISTFVIGFSTLGSETAQLNAIANAGGTGTAFLVGSDNELANALATIVSGSIVFETCNNLDDDCDGKVDEDFPQKGAACDDGKLGACRGVGTLGCTANGSGLQCNITPGATPVAETCNGLDDNCNGAIDEGINCTPGCVVTSPTDLCNGLDDDCDGAFEEDDPDVGDPCGVSNVAPCQFGTKACIGGGIVCIGASDPQPEVCNAIDDNCDGMPDVNAPCPSPTSCIEGGCRMQCLGGEFPCPAGFKCEMGSAGNFCVPSACANCAANEICQNDTCVDPCAGVTCDPLEECRFGTCVDCNVFGCQPGQVCVESACVADLCIGVDCDDSCTNATGCSCNNGACVNNCDDTLCDAGSRCNADGVCAVSSCAGIECADSRICVDGSCVIDPCDGITCRAGQVCNAGACVEDPCKVVACADAFHCELRDDAALCLPDRPAGRQDLVQAGGGGGCDTSGRGGGGAMLLVGLALVAARRRRTA